MSSVVVWPEQKQLQKKKSCAPFALFRILLPLAACAFYSILWVPFLKTPSIYSNPLLRPSWCQEEGWSMFVKWIWGLQVKLQTQIPTLFAKKSFVRKLCKKCLHGILEVWGWCKHIAPNLPEEHKAQCGCHINCHRSMTFTGIYLDRNISLRNSIANPFCLPTWFFSTQILSGLYLHSVLTCAQSSMNWIPWI